MRRVLFLKITVQAMYFGFLAFLFLGAWILACFGWSENPYPWYMILLAACGAWNIAAGFLAAGFEADNELGMEEARQQNVPVRKITRYCSRSSK